MRYTDLQDLGKKPKRFHVGLATSDGRNAASSWNALKERHLAPVEWQVSPRCPLPLGELGHVAPPMLPPLIKGYLRLGAWVCGTPAQDLDFNTADLMVLLSMRNLTRAMPVTFCLIGRSRCDRPHERIEAKTRCARSPVSVTPQKFHPHVTVLSFGSVIVPP